MWGNGVRIERQTLYEEVWAEPMLQLAKRYNISDVGLKKVCVKLCIPVPPRGYWAKVEAGKPVRKATLPMPSQGKDHAWIGKKRDPFAGEYRQVDAKQLAVDRSKAGVRVVVSERLLRPHCLVLATIKREKSLRSRTPPPWRDLPAGLAIRVSRGQFDRAMRIADALVKTLEVEGHRVDVTPKGETQVTIFGEQIGIRLEEKTCSTPHDLTQAEITRKKKEPWYSPPKWDSTYSGDLVIRLEGYAENLRKSWGDGKTQRVEDLLDEVVVGIVAVADALRARTLYWAESARKRHEEAERAAEIERREKLAEHRRDLMFQLARRHSDEQCSRDFIAAVYRVARDEADPVIRERLHEWLAWAGVECDRVDPVKELVRMIRDRDW